MRSLWDYQEDQPPGTDRADVEPTAEAEIEEERQELLNRVSSYSTNTLRDRVAWILNHYPETRDSDLTLQIKYWEAFESVVFTGHSVTVDDLYKLTRLTSITRERARIQNRYKLFLASPEVRLRRGTLSEEEKERAVSDTPPHPVFVVYMDESGKTGGHLLVGSIWFLAGGLQSRLLNDEIEQLREARKHQHEFHFKDMRPDDVPIYRELISLFLKHAHDVSFKLVSVPRVGVSKPNAALAELFYHLIIKGVEHENRTGRAPLPRSLQVWKDAEEEGADKLLLANLEDRIKQAGSTTFGGQLTVDRFIAVNSEHNVFLQVADLLTSSANRVLNRTGDRRGHKDEFADYLLQALNIDPTFSPNDRTSDQSVYIALGQSDD